MNEGIFILILVLLTIAYWVTPIVLIIVGLANLKSKPDRAKNLLIAGTVMLVVGIGFCGSLYF